MKRNAKQRGSGGRLRLGLLMAAAAAFLLVPAAVASAAIDTKVVFAGNGSGSVGPIPGEEAFGGNPLIDCHWNGTEINSGTPEAGKCETESVNPTGEAPAPGIKLRAIADPGSEFVGWEKIVGFEFTSGDCSGEGSDCVVLNFGGTGIEVKAVFAKEPNVHIIIEGEGSGTVLDNPSSPLESEPPINCHWNGETEASTGVCDAVAGEASGLEGVNVIHEADPGSVFAGWEVVEGFAGTCEPLGASCSAIFPPITIKATFDPVPKFELNLTTSGFGSGSFECDTGSGAEACQAEYVEGTEVTVIPSAGTGSEFVEFSGDCSGAVCELTMDGEKNVNAQFELNTYSLTTTPIENGGTGSFECDVNSGGLGACPVSLTHGDVVKVVASVGAESEVNTISGPGSCSVAGDRQSGTCEFTATANSTVVAEFVSEGKIEKDPGNVKGSVDLQTTLATENCDDVDLGPFVPSNAEEEYANDECVVTVTATGTENELRAADETGGLGGTDQTGHLTQEPGDPFTLNKALEVRGTGTTGGAAPSGYLPLSGTALLQDYGTPVSLDVVTVEFRQLINAFEPLHTGTYSKTITLTLEQTVL